MEKNSAKGQRFCSEIQRKLKKGISEMIGPIEKEFNRLKIKAAPKDSYNDINLAILPKYIAYKAALLREKMVLYYALTALLFLFTVQYCTSSSKIAELHKKLREKEYILAPGVLDFTIAAPQLVPDSYVHDAAMDFLSTLGNVSASNIDEQFSSLKRFMSNELKVQFDVDTSEWIEQVREENISQILTIKEKEITTNSSGAYKVVAFGRVDFYSHQQYLGREDQVIEMILKLVPPDSGKRWYLQIESLSWERAETFRVKKKLSGKKSNPSEESN